MLSRQFLTFQLAGDLYGVNTGCVREIIEYGTVTGVPMLPPAIRGVINLRGAAVPVMDLGVRFRNAVTETSRRSCIVVLEITADGIEPAPRFGASIRTDFILGMAKQDSGFVILLDMDRVLGEDDLAQLAAMTAA